MNRKTFIVMEWDNTLAAENSTRLFPGAENFLRHLNKENYEILLISGKTTRKAMLAILAGKALHFVEPGNILAPDSTYIELPKQNKLHSSLCDLVEMDEDQAHDLPNDDLNRMKVRMVERHREEADNSYRVINPTTGEQESVAPLYSANDYLVISHDEALLRLMMGTIFVDTFNLQHKPDQCLPADGIYKKAETLLALHKFHPKHHQPSCFSFFQNKKAVATKEENRRAREWWAAEALINSLYNNTLSNVHEKTLKKEPLKRFAQALK